MPLKRANRIEAGIDVMGPCRLPPQCGQNIIGGTLIGRPARLSLLSEPLFRL